MQTLFISLPAKPALAVCSARRAQPPHFIQILFFIPVGDPSPAWPGNRGHGFSVLSGDCCFWLSLILIYILKPFASSFCFFFFFRLALLPLLLPLPSSKATAGSQGRASSFFAVEGKTGETAVKKSPLIFRDYLLLARASSALPSCKSASNCLNYIISPRVLGGNLAPFEFKATLLEQSWFLEEAPFDLAGVLAVVSPLSALSSRSGVGPSLGFCSVPLLIPKLFPT